MPTTDDLPVIRKLAHDINGPVGNAGGFIDLALRQLQSLAEQEETVKPELSMSIQMLEMAAPALMQLQKLTRMWSATYQLLASEMEPVEAPNRLMDLLQKPIDEMLPVLQKKQINLQQSGNFDVALNADPELLSLSLYAILMIGLTIGSFDSQMKLKCTPSAKGTTITFEIVTDHMENSLFEWLEVTFDKVEDLPSQLNQGVLKPMSYGLIFLNVSTSASSWNLSYQIEEQKAVLEFRFSN